MTPQVQEALQRYLAAERELDDARWVLMAAINASPRDRAVIPSKEEADSNQCRQRAATVGSRAAGMHEG
jgi:hypothetical protein